jgi:uncharacterized protein (DUF4415 family)
MAKKEHIVRYSTKELKALRDRGEAGMEVDWTQASINMPQPKAVLNMRVDRDVLEFFRRDGRGYQTKINAVLRSYVEQMLHDDRR